MQEMMLHWHVFQLMAPEHLNPLLNMVLEAINEIQDTFAKGRVYIWLTK